LLCDEQCVESSRDPQHCGECDNTCDEGATCVDSQCVCPDEDEDGFTNAACGGQDCRDDDAGINPNADEICADGKDNNCDNLTDTQDPICPTSCDPNLGLGDIRLTNAIGMTNYPDFAPASNGLAMVYDDDNTPPGPLPDLTFFAERQVYFSTFDTSFAAATAPVALTDIGNGDSHHPSVAFSGSTYGVVYEVDGLVDVDGTFHVTVAVNFLTVNEAGTIQSPQVTLGDGRRASIAWDGSAFGVVFSDTDVTFTRVDSTGNIIVPEVSVSSVTSMTPYSRILWDGQHYAVVWQDRRNADMYEIYFRKLNADGSPASDELRVTRAVDCTSSAPQIVWTGSEYGVVYSDTRGTGGYGPYQVFLARVAGDGTSVIAEVPISNTASNADTPGILFAHDYYWVTWLEKLWGPATHEASLSAQSPAIDAALELGPPYNGSKGDMGAIEHATSFTKPPTPAILHYAVLTPEGDIVEAPQSLSINNGFSAFPTMHEVNGSVAVGWFDDRDGDREIYATLLSCQ